MRGLNELGLQIKNYYLQEFSKIFLDVLSKNNPPFQLSGNEIQEKSLESFTREITTDFIENLADGTAHLKLGKTLDFWFTNPNCPFPWKMNNPSDFIDILHAEKIALITIVSKIYPGLEIVIEIIKDIEEYFHAMQKYALEVLQNHTLKEIGKSNKLLNQAQEIARVGNWKYDIKKEELTWSENLYALHGVEKDFKPGTRSVLIFLHPEDRRFVFQTIKDSVESGNEFDFHYRGIICGKLKFFHTRGIIKKDNSNQWKIFGTILDVTDKMELVISLKKNEEELSLMNQELEHKVKERTRELEAYAVRFQVLLEAMPLLAWTADPEGKTNYLNSQWLRFTGTKSLEGLKTWDYLHPGDWNSLSKAWDKAKINKLPFEIKCRWKRLDNNYRWFLVNIVPIKNEEGKLYMWLGTATEIHEQEVSSLKKDEFISIASHELRTPLTNIKAYVQLLEQRLNDTSLKGFAEKAGRHVDKLSTLISDLLDISKIQAGHLVLNISEFSLESVIQECIEGFNLSCPGYKIRQKGNFGHMVHADKRRIEQVLNNFISNAIKYSPKNKEVIIECFVEEHQANIAVIDKGIGIPEDKLDKVFDRFFRVDPQENFIKGMGLGLFISKEIINLHNGRIWARSNTGKGSTFCFTLPLAQPIQKSTSQKLYFAQ